jgi:hypothetical protein
VIDMRRIILTAILIIIIISFTRFIPSVLPTTQNETDFLLNKHIDRIYTRIDELDTKISNGQEALMEESKGLRKVIDTHISCNTEDHTQFSVGIAELKVRASIWGLGSGILGAGGVLGTTKIVSSRRKSRSRNGGDSK